MMGLRLAAWAVALASALFAGPATAREIASPPLLEVIGFSSDGRYFAYEQYEDDVVSDAALSAIDVIDRDTGKSAEGFPVGLLGMSRGGVFPLPLGGFVDTVGRNLEGEARLKALRAAVRAKAKRGLKNLKITAAPTRLAGSLPTDLSLGDGPIRFVLSATIPGEVPDQQPVLRATASIAPARDPACVDSGASVDHRIALKIEALDRRDDKVSGITEAATPWPAGDNECAKSAGITDIFLAPGTRPDGPDFVVMMTLAISWAPHAESARYFAAFVKVP